MAKKIPFTLEHRAEEGRHFYTAHCNICGETIGYADGEEMGGYIVGHFEKQHTEAELAEYYG